MTKILVLSDSHNNQPLLRKVLNNEAVDSEYIFHLGDNYEDLDENFDLIDGKQIFKVPGLFHQSYLTGKLPKYLEVDVNNWRFLLVHNIDDIPEITSRVDIFCFGHTHQQIFYRESESHYLNPGHLKTVVDRQRKASYAVVNIDHGNSLTVQLKCCDGRIVEEHTITR